MKAIRRTAVIVPLILALLVVPSMARASDWMWSITPYFWMSDLNVNVQINDRELIDERIDIRDLIDNLDFVFAARLEGQRGKHGFFGDLYFADFSDNEKARPLEGPLSAELVSKGDLEFTILEVGGLYNPQGTGKGLTVLYGARMIGVDQEIDAWVRFDSISSPGRSYHVDSKLWDALVGVRYIGSFSDRWLYDFKADASLGGTDLTWTAKAGVGWAYGSQKQHALMFGYRFMEMDFTEPDDKNVDIDTEMRMAGFYGALKFGF